MDLKKTVKMMEQFEGRDKLCKVLQHLCGILFRLTKQKTKDFDYWNGNMFFGIYKQMGISRQYMRLFKSFQELKYLVQLIKSEDNKNKDQFERLIQIIIRGLFTLYWYNDNMTILCKSGVLQQNFLKFQQKAMDLRLYGLIFSLIINSRNYMRFHHQEILVRQKIPFLKDEQENMEAVEEIKRIRKLKTRQLLIFLKVIGDSFLSFAGTKLADNWFKRIFPKIMVNIGGLTAGIITLYFLYQKQAESESINNRDQERIFTLNRNNTDLSNFQRLSSSNRKESYQAQQYQQQQQQKQQ
ncbi:hypothetical protein PPERSA_01491 [Pseudocohnilembus persalinus]|uniref:Peroxisomal biogenesis factor 11 n=1 Tax=Pseudocohnilembus persalinus TaxID=266149 RepID=A0A0V0QHD9_PSEPJ|nr:hypothetical protein PPERSA_01491 [Pseudocohnilembus persalinus]|eukprot:KRX01588.1 hypothetical protein PPERSA_01491 [Pseudocohnilembus persalinus]